MPLMTDSLTIPAAGTINATGKAAAARQLSAAAARSVVPLVYGEDRIGGLLLIVLAAAGTPGTLLVQLLWCHACDSITDVRLNDQPLPSGASITHYTGAQTVADAALVAAFAAQGITGVLPLTGYAWSLLSLPAALFDGQLNVTALVRGRRCYDPSFDGTAGGVGPQRLADPATWAYTDIPSVCLADFLASSVYGCGLAVDWASVRTASAANRTIVPGSAEQRRLVGVSFTAAAAAGDVTETLRAYAGCFLLPGASGVRLLPDADDALVANYRHSLGQIAAIDALELRDLNQAPTAVEVIYTDRSAIPWRDASAIAQLDGAGTTKPWRLSQVRLPGIHRYGQALREATERLNKLNLNNLSTTLEVFDIGIRHELGDIIEVEHPIGLALTPMRISSPPTMPAPGRWRLPLVRHSGAAYSDIVASAAAVQDSVRVVQALAAGQGGAMNADPGLLNAAGGWEWDSTITVEGPSAAPGALGVKFFSEATGTVNRFAWTRQTFPISAARTYNLSALLFAAPGNSRNMYLVVDMFKADGTQLTGVETGWGGTYAGYTFAGQPAPGQFTRYGDLFDFGAGTPYPVPASAAYFRIGVWFQYSGSGGTSSVQQAAQDIRLVDVTEARTAAVAAAAAQSTADNAADNASSALSTLATMRSNGFLDAAEKPAVMQKWQALTDEISGIQNQANLYGLTYGASAIRQAYDNAYGALGAYLSGLSPSWSDTTGDTAITPAVDQATWAAVYSARQALLNAIAAEAGKRANWTQTAGRPRSYRVGAYGYVATGMPMGADLLDADTNTLLVGGGGMYRVVKIHRINKTVTDLGTYSPLSGGLAACDAMAASLNGIDSAHVCVVYTYDEPQGNRMLGGLPAAMYRNGASRAVWGSAAFRYRSAYILIGIGGCGEGNGAEVYAGSVDSDPSAWCDTTFQLTELGALIVSGASRGATSLVDYGYTGDLDATKGAPAGTFVGGIAAEAVESISGAQAKANAAAAAAQSAAQSYADAQANAANVAAKAYADGIVDAEEARAIADAEAKANAARVAAEAAAAADATAKANVAATTALWTGVSGSGKPADNATRNPVYVQDSDPGSVPDGAIWITSTKAWQRSGGAWVPYVGAGSVDTGELAAGAATGVAIVTFAAISFSNIA